MNKWLLNLILALGVGMSLTAVCPSSAQTVFRVPVIDRWQMPPVFHDETLRGVYYFTHRETEMAEVFLGGGGMLTDKDGLILSGRIVYVIDLEGRMLALTPELQSRRSSIETSVVNGQQLRIHHSSFLRGGDIAMGGEIQMNNGFISSINQQSGHYRPSLFAFRQTLANLIEAGVDLSRAVVNLPVDIPGGRTGEMRVPVRDFVEIVNRQNADQAYLFTGMILRQSDPVEKALMLLDKDFIYGELLPEERAYIEMMKAQGVRSVIERDRHYESRKKSACEARMD